MYDSNYTPDISIQEIENAFIIEDNRAGITKLYSVNKKQNIINDLIYFLDEVEHDI